MNVRAHLAVDRFDRRAPEEPVAKRDAVAAQIHQSAASGTVHVPEPRAVWTKMFFALLYQVDLAECAGVRHLLGL